MVDRTLFPRLTRSQREGDRAAARSPTHTLVLRWLTITTTTRRETNRLRADILYGLAENLEERDSAPRLSRGGTQRVSRCGTVIEGYAMPAHWLNAVMRACAPHAIFVPGLGFGVSRPQAALLH